MHHLTTNRKNRIISLKFCSHSSPTPSHITEDGMNHGMAVNIYKNRLAVRSANSYFGVLREGNMRNLHSGVLTLFLYSSSHATGYRQLRTRPFTMRESGLALISSHKELYLRRFLKVEADDVKNGWRAQLNSYIISQSNVALSKIAIIRAFLIIYIITWSIELTLHAPTTEKGLSISQASRVFVVIVLSLIWLCLSFKKKIILLVANSILIIHWMNLIWYASTQDNIEWFETSMLVTQTTAISTGYGWDYRFVMFNNFLTFTTLSIRISLTSHRPTIEIVGDLVAFFVFSLGQGIFSYMVSRRLNTLSAKNEEKLNKFHHAEVQHRNMITLVLNMLPDVLAKEVIDNRSSSFHVQTQKNDTTMLILDIVGFTAMSAVHPPTELLKFINALYSAMDELCERFGIEKVRTVGDSYICAGNVTIPNADHKNAILRLALEMQDIPLLRDNHLCEILTLRIGISCGTAVYGVAGLHRWHYDITGPVFYEAEYLEPLCKPGAVLVGSTLWEGIEDKEAYEYETVTIEKTDVSGGMREIVCTQIHGRKIGDERSFSQRNSTTTSFLRFHEAQFKERLTDYAKKFKIHWLHGTFDDGEIEETYLIESKSNNMPGMAIQTVTCMLITLIFLVTDYPYYNQPTQLPVYPWYLIVFSVLCFNLIAAFKMPSGRILSHSYIGLRCVWCLGIFSALRFMGDYSWSILFRGTLALACVCITMNYSYVLLFGYTAMLLLVAVLLCAFNTNLFNQILQPSFVSVQLMFFLVSFGSIKSVQQVKSLHETGQIVAFSEELAQESAVQTDKLIRIILPDHIYRKMSLNHLQIAESYPECGCLFFKLVPIVAVSEQVYEKFAETIIAIDKKILAFGLEKIKRVKNVFMIVTGLDGPVLLENLVELVYSIEDAPNHQYFQWYAGIDVGPCAGGVVGSSRVCFDMWGDTINTSSRMSSTADHGTLQVTESVAWRLQHRYRTMYRGTIPIKGKGDMKTWTVEKKDHVEMIPNTPRHE
ncbi:adenylate cyclase type 1-like [Planoprotostelium fungivorum]|uniref:adenylate cyclase n=1 Tax=Planoprotostelium fungivorum TaxID=1890364 RepID=A0A2P6MWK0_9EUKA|nr:adenylate cyclase type 1-like [Planoprotostelium fungivorum]